MYGSCADSENLNAARLSPFKVRVPPTLAANLRRNDSLYLELRRVHPTSSNRAASPEKQEYWVPVVSGPFDGSCGLDPGCAEYDVDPDLDDEFGNAKAALKFDQSNQALVERVRMAERARALLCEGELEG